MGVPLSPSTYSRGGILDDVDVTVNESRFVLWDYNGKFNTNVPALRLKVSTDDAEEHEDYLTAGDAANFVPSDDGLSLEAVGSRTTLSDSSNLAIFLKSLVQIGFDESKMGETIDVLEGGVFHIRRVPAPNRGGLSNQRTDASGQTRDRTVLTVTEIRKLPWENKGAAKASNTATAAHPKKGTAKKGKAKSEDNSEVDEQLTEIIYEILAENTDGIERSELLQAVFSASVERELSGPIQKKLTRRVHEKNGEFLRLGEALGNWRLDDDTVMPAEEE